MGLVLGAGSVQLFLTGLVLCPALVQLGAGGLKLGVGGGSTGAQLELALQQLYLHFAQGGLGFGDKVRVGEVGRGDEPFGVHLLLAGIQLGLITVQLALDVIVGGLCLGKCVPQLGVFLVLRLGLVQRLLGIVQSGLGIAQQGVSHLF